MTTPTPTPPGATASPGHGDASPRAAAEQLGQQAKEHTREQVQAARQGTADHLATLADSARAAADQMRGNDVANLSQYLTRMADGMTQMASRVRDKNGEELFAEVRRLAHENPGLFVAGGLAVGFGLARFARASASDAQPVGSADEDTWTTRASSGGTADATSRTGLETAGIADRPGAGVVASAGSLHARDASTADRPGTGATTGGSTPGSGVTSTTATTQSSGAGLGATSATSATSATAGTPGQRRDDLDAAARGTGDRGLAAGAGTTGAGNPNPTRGGLTP